MKAGQFHREEHLLCAAVHEATLSCEPRFALPALRVLQAEPLGEAHIRCTLAGSDGSRLRAVAFRSLATELGRALLTPAGPALHLAGHFRINRWQGRTEVQLLIEDGAPA